MTLTIGDRVDLEVQAGFPVTLNFEITLDAGESFSDLTDWAGIVEDPENNLDVIEFAASSFPASNTIQMDLSAAQTANLTVGKLYKYNIYVTDSTSTQRVLIYGDVNVLRGRKVG